MADETDDNEESIDVERLEGWNAASVPAGFAERTAAAWLDERRSVARSGRTRGPALVAIALTVVLALGLAVVWAAGRGDGTRGSLVADARVTTAIGERAIAVAERGAELRWQVGEGGRVDVQQSRGAAFYRVERDTEFEVTTPHGSVRVTGTCFTVEVEDMERSGYVKAGVVGAVLAAGIVVSVYEGGVVLARDGREVALAAGERGRADDRGPRRSSMDDDDAVDGGAPEGDAAATAEPGDAAQRLRSQNRELDELRARDVASAAEIEALRAQVESLGGSPAVTTAAARAKRCASANRDTKDCPFVEPDQDTLLEMARCGTVKVDVPSFIWDANEAAGFSAEWGEKAGLSPKEMTALADVGEQFRDGYVSSLQKLYAEAGGSAELAEDQGASALEGLIEPLLNEDELEQAKRRLAQERAGLAEPPDPATQSLADRYVRALLGIGDDFQSAVAAQIGPERARELRLRDNGWPGGSSTYRGTCTDE